MPIVNKPIPIIADDYVEMDFGTGMVKITPAHDPNDFEIGVRHNLEVVKVIDEEGKMNENAGKYCGMTREEARDAVVEELKKLGNLVKIEDYSHNVGHCERCKTIIEPLISSQWFVKMSELAKPAIEVVENNKVRFVDEQYKKSYLHWMYNINDWCISRQIWNGHRIPIFYCQDCGEIIVENEDPTVCPKCGSHNLIQDEDTLDTWFSSALWPISTLGYPDKTEDLKYFYPTDVMVTAREIIYLWVARMIFSGLEYVGDIPFRDIVINGIVKDANGKKMSKTLGNGTDPIEMIDKYGVDSLRFSLFNGISINADSRFSEKKVELSRNFINKIWNAGKYVLMQIEGKEIKPIDKVKLSLADKWILYGLDKLIASVDKKFEKYDLGMAASELEDFFWTKFCDWYIEASKCDKQTNEEGTVATLYYVLNALLKLLHPFIPFITEKIYLELPIHDESIVISSWPKVYGFKRAKDFDVLMEVIKSIRNQRAEKGVPDNKKIDIIVTENKGKLIHNSQEYIKRLAMVENIVFNTNGTKINDNCVNIVFNDFEIRIPLSSIINQQEELKRLNKEIEKTKFEISRSEKLLSNQGFVNKAPAKLINEE